MIKTFSASAIAVLALSTGLGAGVARAQSEAEELKAECETALQTLYEQTPAAEEIAGEAKGILVFPSIIKAGLGIGGERGGGCLVGEDLYYTKTSVSIGFQAGAQSRSEVILFMTDDNVAKLKEGGDFEFGADASAAVLDTGAGGSLDTNTIQADILAFVFGESGLMAGATLEGSVVAPREVGE